VRRGSTQLSVEVERGMEDGKEIVFERQADQSPEVTPGDVKFVIKQQPHPIFTRSGDNLYMKHTLSLEEALLGFSIEVPHLDGHSVKLEHDKVTQPGFVLLVPNEGMPKHNYPSETGNLFVEFSVVFPVQISEQHKQGDFIILFISCEN